MGVIYFFAGNVVVGAREVSSTIFYVFSTGSASKVLAKCLQSVTKVLAKCFLAKGSIDMLHVVATYVACTKNVQVSCSETC